MIGKFADMNLRVGEKLQMRVPASFGEEKLPVRFIGFREHVSVLTTIPVKGVLPLPLREGDPVMVSVFSGVQAFWFKSAVVKVCKTPFEYLHIAFPETVDGVVKVRKAPRVQTRISATVADTASSDAKTCLIANLSIAGAQIVSSVDLGETGKVMTMLFSISPLGIDSSISAPVVIRSANPGNGDGFIYGIEFKEIDVKDKLAIGSYLHQQMIEGRKLL